MFSFLSDEELQLRLFICLQILSLFIINVVSCFGNYVGLESDAVSLLFKILIGGVFVLIAVRRFQEFPQHVWILTLGAGVMIALNLLFFSNYQFPTTIVTFATMCYTMYVVGALISDFDSLKSSMLIVSWVCVAIMAGLLGLRSLGIIHLLNEWGTEGYSMGLGYACTTPAMFFLWKYYDDRILKDLLAFIVMIIGIITFGSRGPLIGIVAFILVFLIKDALLEGKTAKILVGAFVAIFLLFFFNYILLFFGEVFRFFGIESRTITLLFTQREESVHMSGRDIIYEQILAVWEKDPLAIRGINAEYNVTGGYAHNIFLELLFQFGYIVGSIIIVIILWRAFVSFKLYDKSTSSGFVLLFMLRSLCQLLVSGSLWSIPVFWFWLSLLKNHEINYDEELNEELIEEENYYED